MLHSAKGAAALFGLLRPPQPTLGASSSAHPQFVRDADNVSTTPKVLLRNHLHWTAT
jgi:hypothetical protein